MELKPILPAICIAAIAGVLLGGCVSRVEVGRAAAPAGDIEAVLTEINGGATTDFAYSVHLREPGWFGSSAEVAFFYGAHRSECAYGLNLRWAASDRLVIEYQDAKQARAESTKIAGRLVQVELKPGVEDPTAPCGGVEYNLRGGPYG